MRSVGVILITSFVLVGSGQLAFAQHCCHHGPRHEPCGCDHCGQPTSPPGPLTKSNGGSNWTANLKTVEGKIVEVVYLPGATPETGMVEVRVQTKTEADLVRLAPSGFLKQGGLRFREGDSVTIKAFTVAAMEGDIMVATEVDGNGADVRLRGSSGQPLW